MAIETLPESHIDSNGTLGKRPRLEDDTELVRSTSKLLIKRLSDKARLPTRGSKHAAGYDLHRCADADESNVSDVLPSLA